MIQNKRKSGIWEKSIALATASLILIPTSFLGGIARAAGEDTATKSESVYVNTDSAGSVKDETVSVWLHDDTAGTTLVDKADLQNIQNVKGEEQPSVSGDSVSWKLNGNDLYYQGTTTKQLPVKIHMQYFLNGQAIAPKDLAGKSGHFELKLSFENLEAHTVAINGSDKTLYTPLACATALDLPQKTFANVSTNFGSVLSDGSNQVVSFVDVPGLKQSLDMISDYIDFPEELDVTADVTDFSMGPVMILVSPLPNMDSLKDADDLNDLLSKLDNMYDAGDQLQAATGDLNAGEQEFADGVDQLYNGVLTAGKSFDRIVVGAKQLNSGINDPHTGMQALADGMQALTGGAQQLFGGTDQLLQQFGNGSASAPTLKYSVKALSDGAKQVSEGLAGLLGQFTDGSASNPTLEFNINILKGGAKQVSDGLQQFMGQFQNGSSSVPTLKYQINSLAGGSQSYVNTSKAMISALRGNADVYSAVLASLSGDPGNADLATTLVLLTGPSQMATTQAALGISAADITAAQGNYSGGGTALTAGTAALADQMQTSGDPGNPSLFDLANQLASGAQQVSGGADQLAGQMSPSADPSNPSLCDVITQLGGGAQQVSGGASQLNAQMSSGSDPQKPTLYDSVVMIHSGAQQVMQGLQTMVSNSSKLKELQSGMQQLKDALDQFQSGMGELEGGASQLQENSLKLTDGTQALADGMGEFWNQGLSKLQGADRDKLNDALAVKDELIKLGEDYTSFSGSGGNISSSVKFIIKTDEINFTSQESETLTVESVQNQGFFQKIGNWIHNLFN